MKRTPLAALAAAIVLCLTLAGCSEDDPEPEFAPPEETTSATEPTPSVEPSAPETPQLAQKNSAAGAKAFVAYYWRMAEYAQQTGDTATLEALGSPRCRACAAGVKYLESVFHNDGVIQGGQTSVSGLNATPFDVGESSGFAVTLQVRNTRQTVTYPSDRPDETYPAGTIDAQFFVEWMDGKWVVAMWDQS